MKTEREATGRGAAELPTTEKAEKDFGKIYDNGYNVMELILILTVELELACNRGSCVEIYLHLKRFPASASIAS